LIPRLCYITDGERGAGSRPLAEVIRRVAGAGVGMVVLRERSLDDAGFAALMASIEPLRGGGLQILVSRRLDLVRAFDLDGVHLARDAVGVAEARSWLGGDALVGYSAHGGEEGRRAGEQGASYVTLSPIYPTGSKPGAAGRGVEWLREAAAEAAVPVLALGGLTAERTPEVLRAGAWGVAAVSSLGGAADIETSTRAFLRALAETTS
jgi:thiamine-phosphate pyrophosphorylase